MGLLKLRAGWLAAAMVLAALALAAAGPRGALADEWAEFDAEEDGVAAADGEAVTAARAAEEELDEDEFVVEPVAPKKKKKQQQQQQQKQQQKAAPKGAPQEAAKAKAAPAADGEFSWANHYPELGAVVLAVLYLVNFVTGRSQNDRLANGWYAAFADLFERQFAVPGAYSGEEDGARLIKDSQSCYKFYASGRRHCDGMMATLDLVKRHDLISLVLAQLDMERSRDTVTLEVKMDDRLMPPVVFAVVPRKRVAKVKAECLDIEQYASPVNTSRVGDKLVVLADSPEVAALYLTPEVCAVLNESAGSLHALHFSDCFAGADKIGEKVLRLVVDLPRDGDFKRLHRLHELLLHLVDRVAVTKLGAQTLARAERLRREAAAKEFKNSHEARQEAAQRRKDEQKRREEEAWERMTDEQKRRKEEQDYKKALKKRTKMKMMR